MGKAIECSTDGTQHEHNYPVSHPCSNAWVTHPATNQALRCLTLQLWPDTLRVTVKASSYSEAVCVSYIPVVPITTTPLPPFFFRSPSCPCMSSSNTSDTIVVLMVPSMSATTSGRNRLDFYDRSLEITSDQ